MNILWNIQKRLEQFGSGVYDATHTKEDPTQSYLSKWISNVTGIGMQDPTQSLLFKWLQWGANLFTGAKESLQWIWTQWQSEFDRKKEIAKNFLSQKGYSPDVIENTLSKMEYKPWFWTRLATGLWNRFQEAENTTERLQKEWFDPLAGKVTAKWLVTAPLSYAGDVVWTAMEPIWAAISPVVQKVIEKTGQTGNVAEVWKWWEWVRQSNPNFADALEGIVNISSVAPLPLAKPIAGAVKQGGIATGKAIASVVPKIPEWISKIWGSVIQVPKKIVRSWVDTLERIKPWVKDMLVDIDPQSKYAVERSTPKEISKIIEDAKNAKIDPRADYQQTPYHKGAEMANKTVNTIDENLKKRQSERMAILENVPMEKVDLNYSRNTLKSELDKLNIENITIDESWKPVVVPKKWRSALLDQNNPQDMQAIQKLWEILRDDVSPLQTMDNIKILQEWLYENKWTIALKGISKKMDWLVSKVQSSLNKTFKDQLPPEYRKVMDSMSEDMKMSQDMKRLFWIGDDGMPVWNKWELIMKRLTNWTTTWGEARILAEKILKKYGIDLIKEARLRQLSMELVWDTRWANLFWAVLSGKKWMMDWAMWKIGDTMIDKESLIKSYAWKWKIVKPKKQPNLYTKPKKNVWNSNNSNTPINTEWSKKVNTPLNFKSSNNYK